MIRRAYLARIPLVVGALGLALGTAACINVYWKTDVRSIERSALGAGDSTTVTSPVKVHLADGSTVIFRDGALVTGDRIIGSGQSFALLQSAGVTRNMVPMDSVVGVEAFETRLLAAPTVLVSAAATVAGAFGAALLAVAIFGSCPTVYVNTPTGLELQAEGFSYSVSPLMEHRDVDPLRVAPDADGRVRLELRNEALETHYINHIEVLAVRHATGSRVVPDQSGRPVLLDGFAAIARARDRAGRDVRADLAAPDGRLFASDSAVIAAARVGDLDDWIDLDVSGLPPGDSVAVMLRLRNSLLNTVLLYEGMLGGRDAIDWLNDGLQHIAGTVDIARWYNRTMGLRASVDGDARGTNTPSSGTVRMGDVGPIAFRDVALVLPRPPQTNGLTRIRLRFVADNWRIDEARVAGTISRPEYAVLPVDSVVVPEPAQGNGPFTDTLAVRMLADADDQYLETRPTQRMSLVFAADSAALQRQLPWPAEAAQSAQHAGATTYLLAWQGWYREWIRGAWLAEPKRDTPFVPGDEAVLTALQRWTTQKASFEREFYASKLPVR